LTADGRMIEPARPGTPLDFPRVDGPLEVKVVYPRPGQVISVRDSTFLLGSVGSADAQLTVNGASVPVNPNGSFLAWLPVAPRENPRYELVATKNGASARASLEIAHPALPMPLPDTGRLVVDRASAQPAAANGKLRLRGDERVRVSIRAPGNATAAIHFADGTSRALANGAGTSWAAELPARLLERAARIVVVRGPDSVAVPIAPVAVVDPEAPRFVELLNSNEDATSDTDAVTILRPTAAGTYKWFVHPRTIVETTGERGDWVRVRLDASLEAWLEAKYVRAAERTVPVRRTLSNARVTAAERWSDVRIPLTERTPFLVEERRDALVVTLYDAVSNLDIINFPTNDPVVRDVSWEQVASDRVRVTVHLRQAPYGYLTLWERGAFVLRVRKPPLIGDAARPLEGRVIAVDAGHPPIGSTGPTGLYEGDATLAVAQALQPMLEAAGATVVMTRVAPGAVALGDRPIIARRADADVLVSIHLNAHPDGVNPYRTNGSGTYFFHDRAEPLARAVQRGMVRWMGLRDLGVNYDNLALARPTWMPAILCEGAFVIVPDQEAALRTAEFQSRYAIGILEGLEAYFRELGHSR
jgi:N-acetylmuramoyl-L-alanine amidase